MAKSQNWKGYQPDFIEGFTIPLPALGKWKNDLALNKETHASELPFIHFSSFQSISRRLPIFTASNIYREKWVPVSREGSFIPDDRIEKNEQFSTKIYSAINKLQEKAERKMAKGHMVRREDVQWDIEKNKANAIAAEEATFHYTNACPQHQAVNNVIWKELENSILVRGVSRGPKKVIVFTGPVLADNDPWLVLHDDAIDEIRCPLRFWKIVYYVSVDNELRSAAFLMSQKEEVEEDGYVATRIKLLEPAEREVKPFLDFDEKEKYQVNISMIENLTGLNFYKVKEALTEGQHVKLTLRANENLKVIENADSLSSEGFVEGLVV